MNQEIVELDQKEYLCTYEAYIPATPGDRHQPPESEELEGFVVTDDEGNEVPTDDPIFERCYSIVLESHHE